VSISHYHYLLIVICLAMLSVVSVVGNAIAIALQLTICERLSRIQARERARGLSVLLAAPTVCGILAALTIVVTFARHEPRGTTETAGLVLTLLAALASMLVTAALVRVTQAVRRTYHCHQLVERCGRPIDVPGFLLPAWRIETGFPVAAISGVLRPRLILSSRILDECTADELAAVVRHEAAHAHRRDNLVRACLLALPDLFSLLGRNGVIDRHWQRSVEEAADDEAVRSDPDAAAALAGALVRVGRMATTPPPAWMPALALYDGNNLEGRVRRLLERGAEPTRVRRPVAGLTIASGIATLGAVLCVTGTRPLHEAVEWAVRHLP
jgi:beta-lactamase regulating signal transducer with metallopeptidase domain